MNLANGLLSWWAAEDASGGLVDSVGNTSIGPINLAENLLGGTISYQQAGEVGYGVRCANKAQLQLQSSFAYTPGTSWSLGGFFAIPSRFGGTWTASLLRLGDSAPCLRLDYPNDGSGPTFGLTQGGSSSWIASYNFGGLGSTFTHLAITSNAGEIRLYVDGAWVATETWTGWDTASNNIYAIAHHQLNGVAATGLALSLDNAFVYDRALDYQEIYALKQGATFPFAGIVARQLTASAGYGTNSAAQLAGLRAHQLAASVGYVTEVSAALAGLRAHQLAASAGYSIEATAALAGLRAHQLTISVGHTTEPLGMHAPTAEGEVELDAVSSGTTAPTATATVEIAAATPPLTIGPAPAEVSVAAATPPLTLSAAGGVVGTDSSYFGSRAATATATINTSSATPPLTVLTATGTIEAASVTPPLTTAPATGVVSVGAVASPLTVPAATGTIGNDDVSGLWFFVFPTLVKSQLGTGTVFKQETHNRLTATLKNEHGELLYESDFDLLLATIRSVKPLGFLRKPENASGLIELSAGSFQWLLLPRDTRLLDDARASGNESHVALVEFLHAAERLDALTDPFSATNGSLTLTVAHAAHSLAVGEGVAFNPAEDVGGLSLAGLYVVASVINANSYTVLLHSAPTATDAGGGAVTAFVRPISNKWEINHSVSKADFM